VSTLNPTLLGVVTLRAAALAAALAGQDKTANALYSLANLVESGIAVDSHMAEVATMLKDRTLTDADWEDVKNRIHADSARLHSS
jgi:hypothetical protein